MIIGYDGGCGWECSYQGEEGVRLNSLSNNSLSNKLHYIYKVYCFIMYL